MTMLTIHARSAANADKDNLSAKVPALEQLVGPVSCVTPSEAPPGNV